MERKDGVSQKLIKYIKQNNISIEQISKDTGVSDTKLANDNVVFSATEFLTLCSYLNLPPENIR